MLEAFEVAHHIQSPAFNQLDKKNDRFQKSRQQICSESPGLQHQLPSLYTSRRPQTVLARYGRFVLELDFWKTEICRHFLFFIRTPAKSTAILRYAHQTDILLLNATFFSGGGTPFRLRLQNHGVSEFGQFTTMVESHVAGSHGESALNRSTPARLPVATEEM